MAQYKYFHHVDCVEELKAQYMDLCKKHHPDCGGTNEDMAAINAEYADLFRKFKHVHRAENGATYESEDESAENAADLPEIIDILIRIRDLHIELVGSWVWISGDTYAHRDEIKGAGCKWSNKRRMWYWAPDTEHRCRGSRLTYDEIKAKYGLRVARDTESTRKIA